MVIAVLDDHSVVTNVLTLFPGVKPADLKGVKRWNESPPSSVQPGWRWDERAGRFVQR
jgi:hypothetical protein